LREGETPMPPARRRGRRRARKSEREASAASRLAAKPKAS